MAVMDWPIEACEKLQARRSNAGHHRAAVFDFTGSRDEVALFEAVEKAGDVWIACDHAIGYFSAGEAFGRATQDAEDVVLGGREVFGFEDMVEAAGEHVRGAEEVEERGFFPGAAGPPVGLRMIGWLHGVDNTRYNDYCQDALNQSRDQRLIATACGCGCASASAERAGDAISKEGRRSIGAILVAA